MSNAPKQEITINSKSSTMLWIDVIKNAFVMGLNASAIRASHIDEDLNHFKSNCTSDRHGLRLEIKNC